MADDFLCRCVQVMRSELVKTLPLVDVDPKRYLDVLKVEYHGSSKGQKLEVRATEIAELTLQRFGSVHVFLDEDMGEAGKPNTTDPIKKLVAYVGGIHSSHDMLIIDSNIELKTGNLSLPARLNLVDLIQYRVIENIARA